MITALESNLQAVRNDFHITPLETRAANTAAAGAATAKAKAAAFKTKAAEDSSKTKQLEQKTRIAETKAEVFLSKAKSVAAIAKKVLKQPVAQLLEYLLRPAPKPFTALSAVV